MVLRQSVLVATNRRATTRAGCLKCTSQIRFISYKDVQIQFMHTRKAKRIKMASTSFFLHCPTAGPFSLHLSFPFSFIRLGSTTSKTSLITALESHDYSQWDQIIHEFGNSTPFDREIQNKLYDYIINSPPERHEKLPKIADYVFSNIMKTDLIFEDFSFRANCYFIGNQVHELSKILNESIEHVSRDEVLILLKNTIEDIIRSNLSGKQSLALDIFTTVLLRQNGHLQFIDENSHIRERKLLSTIFIGGPELPSDLIGNFLTTNDDFFGSALATTALYILGNELKTMETAMPQAFAIWNNKVDSQHARPIDLTLMMEILYNHRLYSDALELHKNNHLLQRNKHFDVLLKCHAANKDWAGLQQCFESLFGRGDLPNLEHYRIVISALSRLGRIDVVDLLFNGLVSRKFNPTVEIFNSMLFTRFAFGSYQLALELFDKMQEFGVHPNRLSYLIMLMIFRDTKDINRAMKFVQQMLENGMPVTGKEMSVVLTLCANKRDTVTADGVWKWIKNHNIEIDTVLYSSYMGCYLANNDYKSARKIFDQFREEGRTPTTSLLSMFVMVAARRKDPHIVKWVNFVMKKYELQRNSKWYAAMLFYLSQKPAVESAQVLFDNLKEASDRQELPDLKLNVRHYGIMIDMYIRSSRLEMAEKLFEEMKDRNFTPTFKTQIYHLRLISRHLAWTKPLSELEDTLADFLVQGESLLDLTSEVVPRNVIPAKMLKTVARKVMKRDVPAAMMFISQFIEAHQNVADFPEDYKVYALMLEVLDRGKLWRDVEIYWDLFISAIQKRCLVPTELENGEKAMMLPRRYAKAYAKSIQPQIKKLALFNQFSKLVAFYHQCISMGFKFTSKNMNTLVQYLTRSEDHLLETWAMMEHELLGFNKNVVRKETVKRMMFSMSRAVQIQCRVANCSTDRAIEIFNEKYPRTMKAIRNYEAESQRKRARSRLGPRHSY